MDSDILNDDETEHFDRIVKSFKAYHYHATRKVSKSFNYYRELPDRQKEYVLDFEENCKSVIKCIEQNNEIIKLIIRDVNVMFQNNKPSKEVSGNPSEDEKQDEEKEANLLELMNSKLNSDIERVYTTLKQIVRDWSFEGAAERMCCYNPIILELKNLYPSPHQSDSELISVLVPGAGLGRLAFEIAKLGFKCQGNEFSLHMLITSNFILNKCYETEQFTIHPYAHSWSNNLGFEDQIRPVKFPDISPFEYTNDLFQFSMTAGDFLDIYNEENEWNCVVTCFFIDTAHNIIDYVEKIWHILKPGGHWINFGPLLYHYSEIPHEKSIELSYEQLRNVIIKVGFKFLKEETNVNSKYIDNKTSMLRYSYNSLFFVSTKPS